MHIEDLIILLSVRATINPYDEKLVMSFHDQISRGNGFTDKQAALAIKILSRQISKINQLLGQDATPFINNPTFRLSKRVINSNKRVTVVDYPQYTRAVKLEFPFNEDLVTKIRQGRASLNYAQWDKDEKSWFFSLDERSIEFLTENVISPDFFIDEEFKNYLDQVKEIKENFEKYVPTVKFKENSIIFENVSEKVPQPTTTNALESLFLARKAGIHTWDDSIDDVLQKNGLDPVVKKFLDTSPNENFEVLLEDTSFFSIKDIVQFLAPNIFVIPGGTELEKVEKSVELLKSIGVDNSEISILFRLPKETGEKFNNYVKTNQLNNPVTEKTKAVFISSKVPKTIIDPAIKFNSVVNFNFYSVHYTIREFLKNHHNVIHILDKKPQRNINFAFM